MLVPRALRSTLLALTLAAIPSLLRAQAQATTGVIRGTVQDTSGGTLAGASVTLRNLETNAERVLTTNEQGVYVATLLRVGTYEVTARALGFEEEKKSDLTLRLGETLDVPFALKPQVVRLQELTVEAEPLIDVTTSESSTRLGVEAVEGLPNNGRNIFNFTTLTPNVAIVQGPDGDEISIGGQRGIHNNVSVDGADFNNPFFGEQRGGQRPAFTFNLDAVQDFVVVADGANAEFGRSSGGFVNVITKSGTNEFHGSAHYFGKYDALSADFEHTSTSGAISGFTPDFKQHQFGATLGGPIKRDKAFFFFAYDQQEYNETKQADRLGEIDPALLNFTNTAFNGALAGDFGPISRTNDANAFLGKFDFKLSQKHSASLKYNSDLFDVETALGPQERVAGGAETRSTTGCHDITAYPAKGLAVAACRGDGLLLSIADPLNPVVLQRVRDPAVTFWHSGVFDNDATRIVFQDELGDGFINTCSPAYGADRGADAVWLIQPDGLVKAGTYKLPREQSDLEKCVAHSGGLVPVPGRFIIAQAWLEGGVSVVDLTDPAAPVELASFDRPSYGYSMDYTAGIWAVYPYRGHLYASDMYEGLDVLRLTDPAFADAARYDDAGLNPQTQPSYAWVWREAPIVPTEPEERAPLETLAVEPAELLPADTATVTVSLPAGALAPGETADVWWMPTQAVLATVTAAQHFALAPTEVTLPGPLAPGSYDLVVRGDASAPKLALASVVVAEPAAAPASDAAPETPGGGAWWLLVLAPFAVALAYHAALAVRRRRRALR